MHLQHIKDSNCACCVNAENNTQILWRAWPRKVQMHQRSPRRPSSCGITMKRRPFLRHTQTYVLAFTTQTCKMHNCTIWKMLTLPVWHQATTKDIKDSLGKQWTQLSDKKRLKWIAKSLEQQKLYEVRLQHRVVCFWNARAAVVLRAMMTSSPSCFSLTLCLQYSRGRWGSTSSSTQSWTWPMRISSSPPWPRPRGTSKTNLMAAPTNHLRESTLLTHLYNAGCGPRPCEWVI